MDIAIIVILVPIVCLLLLYGAYLSKKNEVKELEKEIVRLNSTKMQLADEVTKLRDTIRHAERNYSLNGQSGLKELKAAYDSCAYFVTGLLDDLIPKMGNYETMLGTLSPQERKRLAPALSVEQTRGITAMTAQEFEGIVKMREIAIRFAIAVRSESLKMVIMPRMLAAHALVIREMMTNTESFAPTFAHSPLYYEEFCIMTAVDVTRLRSITNPDNIQISPELLNLVRTTYMPLKEAAAQKARSLKASQDVSMIGFPEMDQLLPSVPKTLAKTQKGG